MDAENILKMCTRYRKTVHLRRLHGNSFLSPPVVGMMVKMFDWYDYASTSS